MTNEILESTNVLKLLIAEDDDSMRRFLQVTFTINGNDVTAAKDGVEALELALNNDFDLIITDAIMPNMTGYDLCRVIKATPQKDQIPIVILSGFDQNQSEENLADFYLKKDSDLKSNLLGLLSEIDSKVDV